MRDLHYPIKLDDAYPCRGVDARGREVIWLDLLTEGETVGPVSRTGDTGLSTGVVERRADGLWAVATSGAKQEPISAVTTATDDTLEQR